MTRMLIIREKERLAIAELRAFANANIFEARELLETATKNIRAYRDFMKILSINIPNGYRVTYSHEQQPVGLCSHISVSVDAVRMLPSVPAMDLILQEFSMRPITESISVWIEDVDATHKAVNVIQLLEV